MKIGVLICVLMLTVSVSHAFVETSAFEEARPVGSFFLFSTSFGRYVIRHDSMGEVTFGARRRAFWVRRGMTGRIESMYFREHQGDLLLVYEVGDGLGYVARMNQRVRKVRWLASIEPNKVASCSVEGNEVHCGAPDDLTKIDLNTGARVQAN